jgi:hypothetical protein
LRRNGEFLEVQAEKKRASNGELQYLKLCGTRKTLQREMVEVKNKDTTHLFEH